MSGVASAFEAQQIGASVNGANVKPEETFSAAAFFLLFNIGRK